MYVDPSDKRMGDRFRIIEGSGSPQLISESYLLESFIFDWLFDVGSISVMFTPICSRTAIDFVNDSTTPISLSTNKDGITANVVPVMSPSIFLVKSVEESKLML